MKRIVRIGEETAELDLHTSGQHAEARVRWNGDAGTLRKFDVVEVEAGVYSVVIGSRSVEVRVTQSGGEWVVTTSEFQLPVEVTDPRESGGANHKRASEGRRDVKSPMPGKVVRVLVEPGSVVEAGQGLVVVEAMKMQNEMKAPKSGKVIALAARAGASVTAGEVLVTLE